MVARLVEKRFAWPSFSAYEIRDGRIAPAAGAKIRWYDPWANYRRSLGENRASPPYLSLVALVKRLEVEEAGQDLLQNAATHQVESAGCPVRLSAATIKSLLAWSAQHGPLGIFHQTTPYIEWGDSTWAWAYGRWHRSGIWTTMRAPDDRSSLVTEITYHEHKRLNARFQLQKFLGPEPPDEIPAPDSEEFFRLYGEHVWDWLWAAITTVGAIREAHQHGLNALTGGAVRLRRFDGARVRTTMVFPSLLSAFAEMYFQDREGGTLVGDCALCGEPFTTDRRWTTYCSSQCATKARQKRFLERNPDYYQKPKSGGETDRPRRPKETKPTNAGPQTEA
jgi:hypothetical protein